MVVDWRCPEKIAGPYKDDPVATSLSLVQDIIFELKLVGEEVKDIRERLDTIADERDKFHLKEGVTDSQVYDMERRQTGFLVNESEIYGRNEEKEMIIDVLINNLSNQDDVSVYAIWGMGGLGKTTLSQLLYNDKRVERHFELRIWVCVSDDFSILRLMRAIIGWIERRACDITELAPLERRLQENLSGKRFLLVLDDVWNEYHDKWNGLKNALRCGAKGSMLVVTTRSEKVALMMATLPIFNLRCLSEADSRILFKHHAFGIGRREENLELEKIGKAIVKKCGGVKDIRERLDTIADERDKFHLKEGVTDSQVYDMERRQTGFLVNESEIYGRNEEKEMIIDVLINNLSNQDDVSVYAIWGMGGLGKTTLSQLLYNDKRVERHFELRIWVCVSDDFSILRLMRAIIGWIECRACDITELAPLERRLQEKLSGKRFLLVLDDVWNEYHDKWNGLKNALRCGAKGSMLVVTTRNEKVALMMATLPIFKQRCLSEADSWSLFKHRAFGIGRREENLELEKIGKAIVKKCGGLPLAIKALGSLLWFKNSKNEWLSVKESANWDLADGDNDISPVLRLSYNNISPSSRQCFAYCSIFPKDYEMEVDMLIELWIANDFIPSKGETNPYLMGRGIFNNLVCRSFFQDVKEDYKGDLTCKMHDLMHDLAMSIMIQECYIIEPQKELKIPEKVRHLSFYGNLDWVVPRYEDVRKVQSLRSISLLSRFKNAKEIATYISKQSNLRVLELNGCIFNKLPSSIWNLKHLRYLNLSSSWIKIPKSTSFLQNVLMSKPGIYCGLHKLLSYGHTMTEHGSGWYQTEKLPSSIGHLKHLRYLNMSSTDIKSLPESMTCLQNLQTLKLKDCMLLRKLPKGMKNLRNLRCLDIRGCVSLVCMPAGLGQLRHLQTLTNFIVGSDRGQQIGELKELNLSGELTIKGLHNVRDSEDARSANLKRKQDLCALILDYEDIKTDNLLDNDEEILDGLQPHPNLKKLSIWSYQGLKFPNWMLDLDLQNLIEISLVGCKRCEHLPPLGKLPSLKVLFIGAMDAFKCFNNDYYGDGEQSFPALEQLYLEDMPSLEEWTTVDRGESFPRLRELYIRQCPRLTEFPCLPSLGRLSIENSNEMLLRSVMDLTSLSSLGISRFDGLEFLPDGQLQNHKVLESLSISELGNLKTLSHQLDNLSALKKLNIDRCNSLEYLPDGLKNLRSLERLELRECDSLTSLPATGLQGLSSLRSLSITNCKELSCLSEGVKHLTALQDLVIISCPEMTSLPNWLGSLMSLSSLLFWDCPNLISLPDGLQSLKKLQIIECPHLERRERERRRLAKDSSCS
ncbi:unnamed protein product [Ilex paraguariensis]|uniref:Uncharacterized protein n=1 Tax=Ilex paraguariensis TaxID=185542 RepID=A0ABC8UU49_9AQUA